MRNIRHSHIATVYGSLLTRYSPPSIGASHSLDGYTLVVLVEPHRTQTSLEDLLLACGELRADRAISYLIQILSALESIHSAHIIHGRILPKMIFVGSDKGKGKEALAVGVKLAGVSWYQRLINLNKSDPWSPVNQDDEPPDSWCDNSLPNFEIILTRLVPVAGFVLLRSRILSNTINQETCGNWVSCSRR